MTSSMWTTRGFVILACLGSSLAGTGAAAPGGTWGSTLAIGPSDVRAIAAREGLVLAGGRDDRDNTGLALPGPRLAGLYRSTDVGRTWSRGQEDIAEGDDVTLAPIERTPNLIALPATGDLAFAVFGTEVWRSGDAGRVWRRVGSLPSTPTALHVLHDGRLAAGMTAGGLRFSADGGVTWQSAGPGLPARRINDVLALDATTILVATDAGLYRSDDAGIGFAPSGEGLHDEALPALAVTSGDDDVYLAVPPLATQFGEAAPSLVYRSEDRARSWKLLSAPLSQHALPGIQRGALEVAVRRSETGAAQEVLYAGTSSGLWVSVIETPSAGGLSASAMGLVWSRVEPEPGARVIPALAVQDVLPGSDRDDVVHAAVLFASPYVSGSASRLASPGWYDMHEGGRVCGGLIVTPDETLYAACGRHVLRSTDEGATWEGVGRGLPYADTIDSWRPIELGADGSLWVSAYHSGLWRSDPEVRTWRRLPFPGASIGVMQAHPTDPDIMFAAGLITNGSTPHALWRTTDGGQTWEVILEPRDLTQVIAISPLVPNRVFVSGAGSWLSTDGGDTWQAAAVEGGVAMAAYSEIDPNLGWGVGADLVRTQDGGLTWDIVGPTPQGFGFTFAYPSRWDRDTVYLRGTGALRLAVTRDAGATYQMMTTGLPSFPTSANWVEHLAQSRTTPGKLYAIGSLLAGQTSNITHGWPYAIIDPGA